MSDYLEGQIRKHIFRTGAFTKPSNIYIALCTSPTTDASTGSTIVEPVGYSYARQQLNPSDTNWSAASTTDGITSNNFMLTFTASGGNWGTITHVAICDSITGGNVLFHGALTASKTINNGESFVFDVGSLNIQFA